MISSTLGWWNEGPISLTLFPTGVWGSGVAERTTSCSLTCEWFWSFASTIPSHRTSRYLYSLTLSMTWQFNTIRIRSTIQWVLIVRLCWIYKTRYMELSIFTSLKHVIKQIQYKFINHQYDSNHHQYLQEMIESIIINLWIQTVGQDLGLVAAKPCWLMGICRRRGVGPSLVVVKKTTTSFQEAWLRGHLGVPLRLVEEIVKPWDDPFLWQKWEDFPRRSRKNGGVRV